jgi:death on curing protein
VSEAPDYLSYEDLLEIADGLLDKVLVRDHGLLESAAARPQTSVFGEDAYPDFPTKAAALMHSLARNHPLVDGNKRLAWSALRIFCLLNGWDVVFTVDDAERLVREVAAGATDVPEIAVVLGEHLRRQ